MEQVKVLFICMGNICRSPTAHGVFQVLVNEQGLNRQILVDSAGTHSYHIDSSPDPRSQSTARAHGVDISALRARQFILDDYSDFDFLVAMDLSNRSNMAALNQGKKRGKLVLMLDYSEGYSQREVPDPYYGDGGFDQVFDMIADASKGLLEHIRQVYSL